MFLWPVMMMAAHLLYQVVGAIQPSKRASSYVCECREANSTKFHGIDKYLEVELRHRIDEVLPVNKSEMLEKYTEHTFYVFDGNLNCTVGAFNLSVLVKSNWCFHITETDDLWTELNSSISLQDKLCFKQIMEENFQPSVIKCNRSESKNESISALSWDDKSDIIILCGMVMSLPFVFSTIITYAFIKEKRTTFGMILMFFNVTLLIDNILIIFRYFDRDNYILMLFQYFTCTAVYFWLNVTCFYFYWSYKNLFCQINSDIAQSNKKTLILYSIIVLVGSLLYVMIHKLLLNIPTLEMESRLRYRKNPLHVLLLFDFFMVLFTFKKIFNLLRRFEKLAESTSLIIYDNQKYLYSSRNIIKYNFYARLSIIILLLGINGLAEIIFLLFKKYEYFHIYIDFCNTLLGEFIFIIFVCKYEVFVLLKKKISQCFYFLPCTKKI